MTFQVLINSCPGVIVVPSGTEASLMNAESSHWGGVTVTFGVAVSVGTGTKVSVGTRVSVGWASAVWVIPATTVCTAAVCRALISTGVALGSTAALDEQAVSKTTINSMEA